MPENMALIIVILTGDFKIRGNVLSLLFSVREVENGHFDQVTSHSLIA